MKISLFRVRKFVYLSLLFLLCFPFFLSAAWNTGSAVNESFPVTQSEMEAGVARIDITPEGPIRLAGYGSRTSESEGVLQRLEAKALALGSDDQGPSLFITADLIGIPGHITNKLRDRLSHKVGLHPSQLVISVSHTHTGPEIGTLLNHFREPLPTEHLSRIAQYLDQLIGKLEEVALAALKNRRLSLVSWGQGEARFAMNRRLLKDGRWQGFGEVPDGPVDHALPLFRIVDLNGKIKALLLNYACHGTTLGPDINKIHNDWIGEAQRIIEERYPGAVAMISIGAGADANPSPRGELEHARIHGQEIADEVDRLLATSLEPLSAPPVGRYKEIELPYAHVPSVDELIEQTSAGGSRGYYARVTLERIARGESIPASLTYPIQTWTFGDDLTMIFLAGEVVVDYSLRLKKEHKNKHLWITAYANDVPCYIASRRVIRERGYEVDASMYSYNRPSRFVEEIEDLIIETVHELLQ